MDQAVVPADDVGKVVALLQLGQGTQRRIRLRDFGPAATAAATAGDVLSGEHPRHRALEALEAVPSRQGDVQSNAQVQRVAALQFSQFDALGQASLGQDGLPLLYRQGDALRIQELGVVQLLVGADAVPLRLDLEVHVDRASPRAGHLDLDRLADSVARHQVFQVPEEVGVLMAVFVTVGGHVGELELFYTVVIGDRGHTVIRQGGDRHEAHHQRRRQTHGQQGAQFGFLHSMSPPHGC